MQPFDANLVVSNPLKSNPLSRCDKGTRNAIYRLIAKTFISRMGVKETAQAYEMTKTSDSAFQKKISRSQFIASSDKALKINLSEEIKEKLIRKIVRRLKKIEELKGADTINFKFTDPYLVHSVADALKKLNIKWADYHFPESYKISLWLNKNNFKMTESIEEHTLRTVTIKTSSKNLP